MTATTLQRTQPETSTRSHFPESPLTSSTRSPASRESTTTEPSSFTTSWGQDTANGHPLVSTALKSCAHHRNRCVRGDRRRHHSARSHGCRGLPLALFLPGAALVLAVDPR